MGDAMSENQRDMEALALRQHFGKRNRCDKCGQGVLLHFVDGAGVVLCPKEEPCHSHTEWAAGFSMGPRKTRHKVTRDRYRELDDTPYVLKPGEAYQIPGTVYGVRRDPESDGLIPIEFDTIRQTGDNSATT